MPIYSYPSTSIPSSKTEIKFETYRYYLECICNYLISNFDDISNFISVCYRLSKNIQGMQIIDGLWLDRFMKIAWNTEYLLNQDTQDVELIRINNQWSPIQAYFGVYAGCEALSYVIDGNKADGHIAALKKATNFFINTGIAPWDKAYKGSRGKGGSEQKPINFPSNLEVPHNLQRSNTDALSMIAKCLKAEHSNRIDDLWDGKRNKGIFKYKFDPGYTSLLHFLYRLRLKSNYKEVDIFLTKALDSQIIGFNNSLKTFCSWTLSFIEVILMRKCKKDFIIKLAETYLQINPKALSLQNRIECYKKL